MHSCIASETLFVLQVKLFKWKDLVRLFILTNSFFFQAFDRFPDLFTFCFIVFEVSATWKGKIPYDKSYI